jgi:peroxiredoxin
MLRRTCLAFATLVVTVAAHAAPSVGQSAPDFALRDANGKTVKLSDYRGKHVVLEWTNPGCPYVRKHYNSGNMPATQKEAVEKGVVWLAINSTEKASGDYLEPSKLVAWINERKAQPSAVLMDEEGTAGRAYGARTTPQMVLIDPSGKVIYTGAIDSKASANPADIAGATNHVKQALAESLAGKPVSLASTRPYGCSVKYGPAA